MLHHPHPLTYLEVKVTDFEILRWSFWFKVFRIGYFLNLWMDLGDTIPDVRYWSKILRCSTPSPPLPPNLLIDLEVKVTDLEFFMINEMSVSHQSAIRKHSSFKYKNLGGSASIPLLLTPGYMPWGGAAGQNIEHPHALAILSSFFFFCFKCILVLLARLSSGELHFLRQLLL